MPYKRIDKKITEYLTNDESKEEKELIRNAGADRLYKLLEATDLSEWGKQSKELEYSVESGMQINKTVDDYRNFIKKLIYKILE